MLVLASQVLRKSNCHGINKSSPIRSTGNCISASVSSLEAGSLEHCQKVVGDFLGSLKSRQNIEHWEAAWQGDRGSLQGRAKVLPTVTHYDKSLVVKQKKSLPANNNLQTDRQVQNFAEPVTFPRSRF